MRELPRLLAVTTDAICGAPDYETRVRAIAGLGAAAGIVVRAPGSSAAVHAAHAERTVRLLGRPGGQENGAALIIHARPDLARAVGADGVQLRGTDLGPDDARTALGPGWIGVAVHSPPEAESALARGADYLVAGSIFESPSHPGRPSRGPAWLSEIAALGAPVFAIGGITPERSPEVRDAGAWGVAAISALWDAPDPGPAGRALLAPWSGAGLDLRLRVNGELRRVRGPCSVAELLGRLELDPRSVVVELNRRIVRRPDLAGTPLRDGDAVELVHFVGGG